MGRIMVAAALMVVAWGALAPSSSTAEERRKVVIIEDQHIEPVQLPAPKTTGGMPLLDALSARSSSRTFSRKTLSLQDLSDLLWAAWGINRPELGKRTAPSARNWQDMTVYLATGEGTFRYEAAGHVMHGLGGEMDARAKTGKQDFVAEAPVNLIYVSDYSKMAAASPENRPMYAGAHAGFIAQNVYLFCASRGWSTVVRASIDRDVLRKELGLRPDQHIILAQTVGYPAE
jgi:hypothetical protein